MEHTIGMNWKDARDMDWNDFYPVVDWETHKIVAILPASLATAEDQEAARLYTFDEEVYWRSHPLAIIEEHLSRIGVTEDVAGPCDSIVAHLDEAGNVKFADDQESITLPLAEALERLQAMPDNAGWIGFWEAM